MSTYADIPKSLNLPEQMLICIGKLVAEWANCESVFYVIFFCLAGRPNGNADIVWASVQSTRRRMEMITHLLRWERGLDKKLADDIQDCIVEFRSITAHRNFYCHSVYKIDDQGMMASVENWQIHPTDDDVIQTKTRAVSKDTVNQICCQIDNCMALAERAFKLLHQLKNALQLQHVELPPLPDLSQS